MVSIQAALEAVATGFRHIIPEGADHIAFLLGLFFLSRQFGPLLLQVTAFTLAHSLTLSCAMLGWIELPSRWVEIAVGLSILFVAVENLCHKRLASWRLAIVIFFGLIHGLAYAHSFAVSAERPSPSELLPALFGFNLGVELGQVTVVGLAYLVFHPWWEKAWYRTHVALPASALIALSGLFWTWQRW